TDQLVALGASEARQRLERSPELIAAVPRVGGIVRHHPAHRRRELGVVLDHHDARLDARDRLPDQVVVTVDIHAQQVEIARQRETGDQALDVVAIDHSMAYAQGARGYTVSEPAFDRGDVIGVALDPRARPSLLQQVARIVLETVADTELEELSIA